MMQSFFPALVLTEPGMRDAAYQAMPPRHVGAGAHAECNHTATRLRAQALRTTRELQATTQVS